MRLGFWLILVTGGIIWRAALLAQKALDLVKEGLVGDERRLGLG